MIGLRNWQLSIWTNNRTNNLFLGYSQSSSAEEFIRSKTNAPWRTLKTRYYLVIVGLVLLMGDMAFIIQAPESWPDLVAAASLMAFCFGLFVYALLKPKVESG